MPEYLRTPDEVVSFSEYSPELGRPFRALKLWAVLRHYGAEGLREGIRENIRLAGELERWIRDDPDWELCAPRPFSVVCFRRRGSDEENAALMARVNAGGEIFISHTKLDGRYVLRVASATSTPPSATCAAGGTPCARRLPRADQLSGAPTGSTCPVTPDARPLARKSAAVAISSGVASRRRGVVSRSRSSASSTLGPPSLSRLRSRPR